MDNIEKKKSMELDDEVLDGVTGGSDDSGITTNMICDVCGFHTAWAGDYMNGIMYVCPKTRKTAFEDPTCSAKEPSFHGDHYND